MFRRKEVSCRPVRPDRSRPSAFLIHAAIITACTGRTLFPVAVVQPQDRHTDCNAVMAEIQANNRRVVELANEEGVKPTQIVAAGVAGPVIPILWFDTDFQGAASKQVTALQSRQQYLTTLVEERCKSPASASADRRAGAK
jgi:hypothetical protein